MRQHLIPSLTVGASFDTVDAADRAVRRLRAAGVTDDRLTVVCPGRFKAECLCATRDADADHVGAVGAMAAGGAIGAALGGLALAAAIFTGDVAAPATAAALLVVGGAFAGGFSNLIVSNGYAVEPGEYVQEALRDGRIVVGVDVAGDDSLDRYVLAERVLADASGKPARLV